MSSTEYAAGYKAGKSEARKLSVRAAKMYLEMTTPRMGDEYDAGHRAAISEKAAQS